MAERDPAIPSGTGAEPVAQKEGYEPPCIVWEEAYEPIAFGLSCALQDGNPGCFPGPGSS